MRDTPKNIQSCDGFSSFRTRCPIWITKSF